MIISIQKPCSLLLIAAFIIAAGLSHTPVPPIEQFRNVKDYGAKGDGVTDDTKAIRSVIGMSSTRCIFIPKGTYLVSDKLIWKKTDGRWRNRLLLWGESRTETIIKLKDSCPGYTNAGSPKAVIYTASYKPHDGKTGGGDKAFQNSIMNLTVNTGKGNAGAIGIDFLANNRGAVKNVTIRSEDGAGKIGLALCYNRLWPGPCMVKDVLIQGFNHGVSTEGAGYKYGIALSDVTVENQKVAGVFNHSNVLSFENLTSRNSVPAFVSGSPLAFTVIAGGAFTGGSAENAAVVNTQDGRITVRDVLVKGYGREVDGGDKGSGSLQTDYVSHPIHSLFPSPQKCLSLPTAHPPEFHDTDMSNWTIATERTASGIQAAIDAGKSTVALLPMGYDMDKTVYIRGKVKKIFAHGADLAGSAKTAIVIQDTESPFVIIEGLTTTGDAFKSSTTVIRNESKKTVVILHCKLQGKQSYVNTAGCGDLFMEDVVTSLRLEHPQSVWVRKLNNEVVTPQIYNNGGRVWILGIKTETTASAAVIKTINGGYTELLGGQIAHRSSGGTPSEAAFVNVESCMSLSYCNGWDAPIDWPNHVQETRDGVTKKLPNSALHPRGKGRMVPLYVGYKEENIVAISVSQLHSPAPETRMPQIKVRLKPYFAGSCIRLDAHKSWTAFTLDGRRISNAETLRNLSAGTYLTRLPALQK